MKLVKIAETITDQLLTAKPIIKIKTIRIYPNLFKIIVNLQTFLNSKCKFIFQDFVFLIEIFVLLADYFIK